MSHLGCGQSNCDITSSITDYSGNQKFDCCYSGMYFNIKKTNHQLIIPSLLFCLVSRSLSCKTQNNGTNGCEDLDSICMVKKIGTFFGISSKIRLSWIKEWSVAMGLHKNQTCHCVGKYDLNSKRDLLVENHSHFMCDVQTANFAIYISFHKTEVQTVILRCWS